MDIKFTEDYKEPDLLARVLSPLGTYPSKSVIMPESAFIADNDICFILSLIEKIEVDNENYYSEMEWASLEEIRLFASLLIGVKPECKYTRVYPFPFPERITVSGKFDFENLEITNKIKKLLIKKIDAPDKQVPGYPEPQRNLYQNLYGISLPPSNGGPNYDFRGADINYKLLSKAYNSINKKDFLTIRGLSVLIKSIMLSLHHQFIEEAIINLFISLEASLRLILRVLKQKGNKNPTSEDAMNYLLKAFDMPPLYINDGSKLRHMKNYFQEYYESRIKSVHPESRFGIFPHAQLEFDDFYELKDDLIEVFTFLLTGQVNIRWQNDD
jgi:hypothetical protein